MSTTKISVAEMSDAELYRFGQDKTSEIFQAMEKAGNDAVKGIITPEQSDLDIGRLMDELKIIQNAVGDEQSRRKNKKRNLHRIVLIGTSILAAVYFYFVFFN